MWCTHVCVYCVCIVCERERKRRIYVVLCIVISMECLLPHVLLFIRSMQKSERIDDLFCFSVFFFSVVLSHRFERNDKNSTGLIDNMKFLYRAHQIPPIIIYTVADDDLQIFDKNLHNFRSIWPKKKEDINWWNIIYNIANFYLEVSRWFSIWPSFELLRLRFLYYPKYYCFEEWCI